MLKQQMFEHRTVSLVPFPVRHRVHQPRRISSGETIKTENLTFLRRAGVDHLLLKRVKIGNPAVAVDVGRDFRVARKGYLSA